MKKLLSISVCFIAILLFTDCLNNKGGQNQQKEIESVTNSSDNPSNNTKSLTPETDFSDNLYGYTHGEWEMKLIHIQWGDNKKEVVFHIHIEESGMDEINIDIQGIAQLKGNSFRYKEKDYEFEIFAYKGFITLKTISGSINGYKADGDYPEIIRENSECI